MFRYAAFQVLTWGTVLGAVVCAVLLAMIDKPAQPVVEAYTLSSLWPLSPSFVPSPGPAASAAGRMRR